MTEKLSSAKSADFDERYARIKENIAAAMLAAGRSDEVLLLGATKTQSAELINYAISRGLRAVGENRVQEYLSKYDALNLNGVARHFIGNLQTNKVKSILDKVDMIESVGSVHLAEVIGNLSEKAGKVTDILLEVNIGSELSKGGLLPEQVDETVEKCREINGLRVMGLMTIPPICDNEIRQNVFFEKMQKLFVDICSKNRDNINITHLSMGMSDDYESAIRHGATIVRLGTALFGGRQSPLV